MQGRDRVRWSFVLCLSAVVAVAALAGCGSSGSGGTSASGEAASAEGAGSEFATTTPAATGPISEFTWDLPYGEPASLDPALSFNYSENTVLANVCDALLRETPQQTIEPALAEKVLHPTPLTWKYEIRKGVKFFDGSPLTPADVVANLDRQIDPATGSYYYSSFGSEIKSVKQTGPDEVTVTTKKPNTLINEMMATGLGTIVKPSSIEQQGKNFGTSSGTLDCTGAFELTKWSPGSGITLTRNPHYWDKKLEPKAETVNFKFISDPTALANALISGEVDGTYEAPISAVEQLKDASDGKFYLGVSTQGVSLAPLGNPVTRNPKIRKALYATIERAGIAETAYAGTATAVKSTATPESAPGQTIISNYYESLPEPGPDLETAKKLVEEAGSPTTPIRLAVSSGDAALLQAANAIQSSAKEAGLNIKIETLPPNQAIALSFEPEKARPHYDMFMSNTYSDVPNLLEFYSLVALPNALTNVSKYDNPATTKAIERGLAAESDEERDEAIVEVAEHLDAEVPELPIERLHERLFMNNKIAGAPATFPYQYYPWAALVGAGS